MQPYSLWLMCKVSFLRLAALPKAWWFNETVVRDQDLRVSLDGDTISPWVSYSRWVKRAPGILLQTLPRYTDYGIMTIFFGVLEVVRNDSFGCGCFCGWDMRPAPAARSGSQLQLKISKITGRSACPIGFMFLISVQKLTIKRQKNYHNELNHLNFLEGKGVWRDPIVRTADKLTSCWIIY